MQSDCAAEGREQSFLGKLADLRYVTRVGGGWVAAVIDGGCGAAATVPSLVARNAACPYFALTTSLMFFISVELTGASYLQIWTMSLGFTALLRLQHFAYRNRNSSWSTSVLVGIAQERALAAHGDQALIA